MMSTGLFVATLVLAGGSAGAGQVPLPRPAVPAVETDGAVPAAPSDCDARLARQAEFTAVPPRAGPGACGGTDLVELRAILLADAARVAVAPAPVMQCGFAEQVVAWIREDAAQRLAFLGAALRRVDAADGYDCRPRNRRNGGKISEHGKGDALDIRDFVLADGRADGSHEQHIHLDALQRPSGYRICEWDLRAGAAGARVAGEGPPAAAVPLPVSRPARRTVPRAENR